MVFTKVVLALAVALSSGAASSPSTNDSSPDEILDRALMALGGEDALGILSGVTYHAPKYGTSLRSITVHLYGSSLTAQSIYRSRSLMQSYELTHADTAIAIAGRQNVSFRFTSDELVQRIDRRYTPSDYWTWSSPTLDSLDHSLVVRGGLDGFGCYMRGNNQIWLPPSIASGYTDAALAQYLVLHGEKLSPKVLLKIKNTGGTSLSNLDVNGVDMQAVYDPGLNLTVIFHPSSDLPYIVRSIEYHSISGSSTNDLYLTNYREVNGLMFPHSIQTVYNSSRYALDATLEDYTIEQVDVDPEIPSNFFDELAANESMPPRAAPMEMPGVSHARITEFESNMLWGGITHSDVESLQVQQPIPDLPAVHWLVLDNDTLGVKQLIIEFNTEVIVGDAPPQWTSSVIQWVAQRLKKPITHLWPTHHHGDYSGGANEYIAAGAKLIVPEMAAQYWSSIRGAQLITFNDTHPYVHVDGDTQAWFLRQPQATHASDWSYSFITSRHPSANSSVAVFEADVWQAGMPAEQSDQALMRHWLDQLVRARLTMDAVVLPTHGQVSPLADLINITGYPYPQFSVEDWRFGAALW